MGADSKIEWTRSTFNPWWGCEKVSRGCRHCYAEAFDRRTHGTEKHTTAKGEVREPHWGKDAPRRFFGEKHWREPLKWNAEAERTGEPWRVFCASMADVFEDRPDLPPWREKLWALIEATPALTWLLLTKRPQNIPMMSPVRWGADPGRSLFDDTTLMPRNVWVGATVEGPDVAHRISALRAVPAALRFLSVEPQVTGFDAIDLRGIGWLIQGGESGAGSDLFYVKWARWMRDECRRQGVAYLLKQLGARPCIESDDDSWPSEWASHVEIEIKHAGGPDYLRLRDSKGGDWLEWPEDLRVRQFPLTAAGSAAHREAGA